MQRTYGRKARRRPLAMASHSGHSSIGPPELNDMIDDQPQSPSRPRKRQKVFVEIVSPPRHAPRSTPPTTSKDLSQVVSHNPEKPTSTLRRATTHPDPVTGGMSNSPKTPTKSPKDPSALFATPSPLRTQGQTPRGSVIKRMLSRSRTETSIEVSPGGLSPAHPSTILNVARSKSSQAFHPAVCENKSATEVLEHSPSKHTASRNIRTYAGSSRSFLMALPISRMDGPSQNFDQDDVEMHESYADLRSRWGVDNSEDDPRPFQDNTTLPRQLGRTASTSTIAQPPLPNGMMNDLKSITELRSKGESRRFLDEVGYLFEGLDGSSAIGLRRASALEVVNKLCDPDFSRRAKTSDFYICTWHKLLESRAGTNDKIFDATIAFFASLVARDATTLVEVAQQPEFIPTLLEILRSADYKKDVLASVLTSKDSDLKSRGVLRTEIPPLRALAAVISKGRLLSSSEPSARLFISNTLAALPPSSLERRHMTALLNSLRSELGLLEPRIAAYTSGLPLLPPLSGTSTDVPSLHHIEACLRLMDSYFLQQWSTTCDEDQQTLPLPLELARGFASELLSLSVVSETSMREGSCNEDKNIARKCLCGALRILTLLSHDDEPWCEASLKEDFALPFITLIVVRSQARWTKISASGGESPRFDDSLEAFDLLCLALGLLMNWAVSNRKMANLCRDKLIDPACPGTRACIRVCQCPDQQPILQCLSAVYAQYSIASEDDPPECVFLKGYLSVLLGLLMMESSTSKTMVLASLSGGTRSDKLGLLLGHCRVFLDLYTETTNPPSSSPRASPEISPDDLRIRSWNRRGEDIARRVIASLELLGDTP